MVSHPLYTPKTPFLAILAPFWGYMPKIGVHGTIIGLKIQKMMTRDACTHNARAGAHTRVEVFGGIWRIRTDIGGIIG